MPARNAAGCNLGMTLDPLVASALHAAEAMALTDGHQIAPRPCRIVAQGGCTCGAAEARITARQDFLRARARLMEAGLWPAEEARG